MRQLGKLEPKFSNDLRLNFKEDENSIQKSIKINKI